MSTEKKKFPGNLVVFIVAAIVVCAAAVVEAWWTIEHGASILAVAAFVVVYVLAAFAYTRTIERKEERDTMVTGAMLGAFLFVYPMLDPWIGGFIMKLTGG